MGTITEVPRVVVLEEPQVPTKPADHVMAIGEVAKMQQDASKSLPTEGDIVDLTQLPDGGMKKVMEALGKESCLTGSPGWNGHFY